MRGAFELLLLMIRPLPALLHDAPLEHWHAAVEDKERLDFVVEQLEDSAETSNDMRMSQHFARLPIAHGFDELCEPDRSVDG